MKRVLIMVVSLDEPPYDKMIQTAMETWDSVDHPQTKTIFYCGLSSKQSTDKIIYFPYPEGLFNMGHKDLLAFEWALKNKEFDYIARTNAPLYVHKQRLIDHIELLPENNVFAGLEVTGDDKWMWGAGGYIISKDVLQSIVDNKDKWDHTKIEDMAMSQLVSKLDIPYTQGIACSIDKTEDGWRCVSYGLPGFDFKDFSEINQQPHFFFRCKQDYDRTQDEYVMKQLFTNLK